MSDKLVTIATFPNAMLAAVARNRLEDEGIRAFTNDGANASVLFGGGVEAVKLEVTEEDAERALEVLDEEAEDEPAEGAFTEVPPGPGPEDLEPEDPEEKPANDPLELIVADSARDLLADRALTATILGTLFCPPIMIYAVVLLWQVYISDEPLRPGRRLKAFAAAGLALMWLTLMYLVWSWRR